MDIQDFAKVFSAFSLLTYDKRATSFSTLEAVGFLKEVRELKGIDFVPEDYLIDAKKAVCLLIDDGSYLSYSHRSFQEYFVALFIANECESTQEKLIEKYYQNIDSDRVIWLLHDLKLELVEQKLIIPEIQKIEREIGYEGQLEIAHYSRYLNAVVEVILFFNGNFEGYIPKDRDYPALVRLVLQLYGVLVAIQFPFYSLENSFSSVILQTKIKNAEKVDSTSVPISEITNDAQMTKLFGEGSHVLSFSTLKALLEIKEMLVEKHNKATTSLSKVLSM